MSSLVIKNFPERLHERLKAQAERNRRSLTQEAISLLEAGITVPRLPPMLRPPVKVKGGPISTDELEEWTNDGRE